MHPNPGEYTLQLIGGSGAKHVFAVKELGVWQGVQFEGEQQDYSMFLLIGAGVLLVIGIVLVVALSARKKNAKPSIGSMAASGSSDGVEGNEVRWS